MSFQPPRLILASKSPRRHDLLTKMGFTFSVHAPDVDENIEGAPCDMVRLLSERKANAVRDHFCEGWIVAADTLVALGDKALGKPADQKDAFRMLASLSGRNHQVYTGVCLMDAKTGRFISKTVRSDVYFKPLSPADILSYIQTGEPMDKAGAYAIQGGARRFIEKYEGSFDNIVGFPTEEFRLMYDAFIMSHTEE
ncbi:MAG: septum formation protein Maf [Clostridia bacterium]|nr:septum formation protein Maf [Clostridia bacterium]MBQ2433794.1 septum formation protein Maf [Clostridia bacterium]MBQ5771041.1 septum formation protein Maf [Clostridia bacterium]